MLITLPDVLRPEELHHCRTLLAVGDWADGRATAGEQAALAKHNLQLPIDSDTAATLGDIVLNALGRNPTYHSAVLPLRVLPPRFNRYDVGMTFGAHVDNAIQTVPGTGGARMRADVSSTLFLSNPDEYDGGELLVTLPHGTQSIKLPAGHMVIYPASTVHRVAPVTRGSRWASFFWAQSLVKDDGRRQMLYELDQSIIAVRRDLGDAHQGAVGLVGHYHNLLRQWSEL